MKPKVVKHLSDIEIDEISLVDRGANQHATVAIAKRAPEEELHMPELFTEEGTPLDENELVDGQVVYDNEGNAYQFSEDDTELEFEDEGELVGKAIHVPEGLGNAVSNFKNAYGKPKFSPDDFKSRSGKLGSRARIGVDNVKNGYARGNDGLKMQSLGGKAGKAARKVDNVTGHPNKEALQLAGGAAAVTAAGYGGYKGYQHMKKSFSDEVMEELSKAYSDEERDQVLSKALGQVEHLLQEQAEAVEIAKAERELRLTNEYVSKAAEYNLPVNPVELGPVLYRMAESMDYDDCMVIHKCLESAGAALFDEVGYIGGGDNTDVLGYVNAAASEYVGKSAAGVSKEEALDAVFEANPGAYDEYLAQRRGF